jgi:hypothetical protein
MKGALVIFITKGPVKCFSPVMTELVWQEMTHAFVHNDSFHPKFDVNLVGPCANVSFNSGFYNLITVNAEDTHCLQLLQHPLHRIVAWPSFSLAVDVCNVSK